MPTFVALLTFLPNGYSGSCVVSVADLAQASGQAPPTIRRHLKLLERAGLVQVERTHHEDGASQANRYTVIQQGLVLRALWPKG